MLLRDRLRAPSVGLLVVGCLWTGFPLDTPRVVGLRLRIAGRRRSRLAAKRARRESATDSPAVFNLAPMPPGTQGGPANVSTHRHFLVLILQLIQLPVNAAQRQ